MAGIHKRRVVITGAGLASPIGHDRVAVGEALRTGRHGVVLVPEWGVVEDLLTKVGAKVRGLDLEKRYPRKKRRTMGRVALLATYATEMALGEAGLDAAVLSSGRTGVAYGSTFGSGSSFERSCDTMYKRQPMSMRGLESAGFLKYMAHTCAANLAQSFAIRGRMITTCSACTSGSQAIGAAYEAIAFGQQDAMIAGGAEELHFSAAVTFDLLMATSTGHEDRPEETPRPFDRTRDGLVIGEGAGTLILESEEHARARGATILGEIVGYGTNCDGEHLTQPAAEGMRRALELALADAGVDAIDVDYVNAHGTGTLRGDLAESRATYAVFERAVPFSSTKSYTGHTLGACGAIEAVFCLTMMEQGFLAPNRNLVEVDPECAPLGYLREVVPCSPRVVMSNNFAFGGVNTSLIFRTWE